MSELDIDKALRYASNSQDYTGAFGPIFKDLHTRLTALETPAAGEVCPMCGGPSHTVTEMTPVKWGDWPEVEVEHRIQKCLGECGESFYKPEDGDRATFKALQILLRDHAAPKAELKEARGLLEEVSLPPYPDSDPGSLLDTLRARAAAYLTRTKPEEVEPTESVEKVCTCDELEWDKNCTVHTDAYFKPAPKEAVIKVDVFSCPEHGPTMADEDGCCSTCGADTKIGSANLTAPT